MADALHKNAETVGSISKDLVLNTFGRIYIRVRDKYYELNYDNTGLDNTSNDSKNDPDIIILESSDDLTSITYPGDSKVILTLDGGFYITVNGEYRPYTVKQTGSSWEIEDLTVKNSIKILTTTEPPFIINSKQLVENLNAQYLNGYTDDKFAKKAENESISGNWTIKNILFIDNVLKSTNNKNTLNDTILDFANSTLDIDYINVRKAMRVYEYIINRIKCTNGSFWVSDSAIVEYKFSPTINSGDDANTWSYTIVDSIQNDYNFGTLDNEWHTLEEWYNIFIPDYSNQPYIPIDINNKTQVDNATTLLTGRTPEGIITNEILWNKTKELYPTQYGELSILNFLDTLYNSFYNIDGVIENFDDNIVRCTMKDETSSNLTVFWVNDVIRLQKTVGYNIYNIEGVVTRVENKTVFIKLSSKSNGVIEEGDTFVRIDNVIHPDRRGAVYMTSADYKAPYIDVIDNTNYSYSKNDYNEDITDEPYVNNSNIKIRLGRLDGLAYDEVFGRMSGMGIFIKGDYNPDYVSEATTILGQIEEFAQNNSGGLYIKDGCIALGSYANSNRKVGILLNNDGSGYLAQGHIYWNKEGTLYLDGGSNEGLIILNGDIKLGPNSDGSYRIELNNIGSAKFGNGSTKFYEDGGGSLANGHITWTMSGAVISDISMHIGNRSAWLFSKDRNNWSDRFPTVGASDLCYAIGNEMEVIPIYGVEIYSKTTWNSGIPSTLYYSFTYQSQYSIDGGLTFKDWKSNVLDYMPAQEVQIKVTKKSGPAASQSTVYTKTYTSNYIYGIQSDDEGVGSIGFGNLYWNSAGSIKSRTALFEDITILDETSQIYYIDEKINLIAKPTSSELNIVLPAANDKYIGKNITIYKPVSTGSVSIYVGTFTVDSPTLTIPANTAQLLIYTYNPLANLTTRPWSLSNGETNTSAVLYSGHISIPTSILSDPFSCTLTKYSSAPNIEVQSVQYQYASNPDVNQTNNWFGYIYHNIGHTNYAISLTPVPYEYWVTDSNRGMDINDVICRVVKKYNNTCIFQINKTDGARIYQELDFVIYGSI